MAADRYDAIILGAGHNGLVCGTYLAKAGLKVLVLERRHVIGGAAVTEEFSPGFRASIFSYVMSILHPRIIADLELRKFGLEVLPANDLFSPLSATDSIIFSDDMKKTQEQFARFSPKDAAIYPEFDAYLQDLLKYVRKLLFETPVDPVKGGWRDFKDTAQFVWRYRDMGGRFYRILDLLTQSAYDYLSQWFESDTIKAIFGYYASIGTFASPKTPGSAYVLLHHLMGEHQGAGGWGFIKGGMGAITQAIAQSGARFGLEIKTERGVGKVLVEEGRAVGVVTDNGEEYRAGLVISNLDAKTLMLRMVERDQLPADYVRDIEGYRTFSTAFKINVACHRPPQYTAFDPARAGFDYPTYVHIAPDIDYLERAYDDAKYGWYSQKPFITPVVPTIRDTTLGPARQARRQPLRRARPLRAEGRQMGGRARQFQGPRPRRHRDLRPRLAQRHHRHAGPARPRHRADRGPAAGPHLPGRARPRPGVLHAPGGAVCRLPHPDPRALHLRQLDASGRRRLRHPRPQCRPRGAQGPKAAAELSETEEVAALGQQIRALRQSKAVTLAQLAERTGLSIGHLSQVERGLSTPTIRQLQAISTGLGVRIGWFFQPMPEPEREPGGVVVRAGHRRRLRYDGLGMTDHLLTPSLDGRLELLLSTLEPGASSGEEPYSHEGEEAGLILEGTLELWIDDEHHLLAQGDSFAFASTRPHRYRNPGSTTTKVVWAITPPSF